MLTSLKYPKGLSIHYVSIGGVKNHHKYFYQGYILSGTNGGHWGSPNKVHKVGGLDGDPILIGDSIWFEQMIYGYDAWNSQWNIYCDDQECGGDSCRTEFQIVIGTPSSNSF